MAMHTRGRVELLVSGLTTMNDTAELSKLAMGTGLMYQLDPRAVDDRQPWAEALVYTPERELGKGDWLEDLAYKVIAIEAVTRDVPVDQVLENVRKKFEKWHFGPLDKKPSDNREFGAGHVEGH